MDKIEDVIDKGEQDEAPKCELKWEGDRFSIECEDPESADKAHKAAQEHEVVIRVKTDREDGRLDGIALDELLSSH